MLGRSSCGKDRIGHSKNKGLHRRCVGAKILRGASCAIGDGQRDRGLLVRGRGGRGNALNGSRGCGNRGRGNRGCENDLLRVLVLGSQSELF